MNANAAVENLEYTRVENMLEHMLQHFSELDVSSTPGLRDLPASQQQHVIDGLAYTFTSYQDQLRHTVDQQASQHIRTPRHHYIHRRISPIPIPTICLSAWI